MRRSIQVAFLLVSIFFIQSCQLLQEKLQEYYPAVIPGEANIQLLSYETAEVSFPVEVRSNSESTVKVKEINYTISVAGEKTTQGTLSINESLQAGESKTYSIVKKVNLGKKVQFAELEKNYTLSLKGELSGSLTSISSLKMRNPQSFQLSFSKSSTFTVPSVPDLKLKQIEITSVDFLGANFDLVYEAKNQTSFPVTLQLDEREIYLNNQEIAESSGEGKVEIGANETKEFREEVRIHFISSTRNLYSFLQTREAKLSVQSEILLKSNYHEYKYENTTESVLSLPSLPEVRYVSTSFSGMDFESVNAKTIIELENTADVPLNFNGLYLKISEGSATVASSELTKIELAPKEKKNIPIEQKILFSGFASSAEKIFSNEKMSLKVDAGITGFMGTDSDPIKLTGNASFIPLKLPTLSFETFKWKRYNGSITDPSAEFALVMSVKNPNQFSMELLKIDYSLEALGSKLVSGQSKNITVAKSSSQNIEIPVILKGQEMLSLVSRLKSLRTSEYTFNGTIQMKAAGEVINLSFP